MNNPTPKDEETNPGENSSFNLTLAYSLLVLALLAAIGIAMMIIYPFYIRR